MSPLINGILHFNFPAILLLLLVITGVMWLLNLLVFLPKRKAAAQLAITQYDANQYQITDTDAVTAKAQLREHHLQMPWWLEYTAGFFTVVLTVFFLRSFIAEPFRIPSASMMPTLQSGDLILVNKFTWGLRMPVYNNTLIETGKPDRGDVIVFRFPVDESLNFIKRVVGLPGDVIEYNNKILSINGQVLATTPQPDILDETGEASGEKMTYVNHLSEALPKAQGKAGEVVMHSIYNTPNHNSTLPNVQQWLTQNQACVNLLQGLRCTVPAGHYFAMGDNRDNSQDSRYWGFVPEKNIVGKAFFIWMNLDFKLKRLGFF